MSDPIDIQLAVSGEQQVVNAVDKVASSIDRLDKEQKGLNSTLGSVTSGFAKFQSSIGIASQTIGQFSQTGGRAIGVIGQAAGATATLTAAFGPLGIALGAGAAALGIAGTAFSDMKKEVDDTKDAVDTFAEHFVEAFNNQSPMSRALSGFDSAFQNLFGVTTRNLMDFFDQQVRNMGIAAAETFAAMGDAANIAALNIEGVIEALKNGDLEGAAAILDASQQAGLALVNSAYARAGHRIQEDMRRQGAPTKGPNKTERRGRGGGGRQRRPDALNDQPNQLDQADIPGLGRVSGSQGSLDSIELINMDEIAAANEWAAISERINAVNAEGTKIHEDRLTAIAEEAREVERLTETYRIFTDQAVAVGEAFGQAFTKMALGEAKGKDAAKILFAAVLDGIGQAAAAFAALESAKAAASFADKDIPGGVAHTAAATAFGVAAGVAQAGAASLRASAGGGGGGGGGKALSAPGRSSSGGNEDRGGMGGITIVWNQPAILAGTYSEAGRAVLNVIEEAEQRYGRRR